LLLHLILGGAPVHRCDKYFAFDSGFTGCGKNSLLPLILGGAAVYRCDKYFAFDSGFSRRGSGAKLETTFSAAC
jgi:hypothetical protein